MMPWYRSEDGSTVMHLLICRSRGVSEPEPCRAPRLETDNPAIGEICGRKGGKLCDGPRTASSPLGSRTCDRPICPKHATHVDGKDLDYCPEHAHLAPARTV